MADLSKILFFRPSTAASFVEKFVGQHNNLWSVVFKEHFASHEILEEKPDIIVITETEIDALMQSQVLREAQSSHRFHILSFLEHEDLKYRLDSYQVGAQDCLSLSMPLQEVEYKLKIQMDQAVLMKSIPPTLHFNNMVLFPAYRRVLIDNEEIHLAHKEFEILHLLLKQNDRFVKSEELVNHIWKGAVVNSGNVYTQFYNLKKDTVAKSVGLISHYSNRSSFSED